MADAGDACCCGYWLCGIYDIPGTGTVHTNVLSICCQFFFMVILCTLLLVFVSDGCFMVVVGYGCLLVVVRWLWPHVVHNCMALVWLCSVRLALDVIVVVFTFLLILSL